LGPVPLFIRSRLVPYTTAVSAAGVVSAAAEVSKLSRSSAAKLDNEAHQEDNLILVVDRPIIHE
jgi:hypothetical protein